MISKEFPTPRTHSVERIVERFYHEVWNKADEAAAREILCNDFRFRASLGPEMVGADSFIGYMQAIHAALASYRCTIEELVRDKDNGRAAARMRFQGIHRGVFFNVPATGRVVEWTGAAFFETNGDRIASLWVLGDVDAVRRQLGAGPLVSM